MPLTNINDLPPEILIEIFWLANSERSSVYLSDNYGFDHEPFNPVQRGYLSSNGLEAMKDMEAVVQKNWDTKLAIPLVCKLWNTLSQSCTYNDMYIGSHCTPILEHFEHSQVHDPVRNLGSCVRRIVLHAWEADVHPISISRVLRLCPNAHTLIKGDNDATLDPDDDVCMTSIRRFEWKFVGQRGVLWGRPHTAKGLDFLREVCNRASNLQYLLIAVLQPNARLSTTPSFHITLSSLTIIVLRSIGGTLRQELEQFFHFPSLQSIVTDSCLAEHGLSSIFTPQIKRIQFLADPYLLEFGALSVVDRCPQLSELWYHTEVCSFAIEGATRHEALECVHLSANRKLTLVFNDIFENVAQQLEIFGSALFPGLRRICLHGSWSEYEEDPRIHAALQKLCEKGRTVEHVVGTLTEQFV